jgi:sec-independent protein translocase protein TatA
VIANIFGPDLGYVVMIVLIVLVGGSQLPKIARNIGTAGKEFRKAQQEAEEEAQRENAAQAQPAVAPAPVPPAVFAPAVSAAASPEAREEQVRREAAG